MRQRLEVALHPSKIAFATATVVLIGYLIFLRFDGFYIAEHWLLALVPLIVSFVTYLWRTEDRSALIEPLNVRTIAKNYFLEQGWWVAIWLVLIFGFGYFVDR